MTNIEKGMSVELVSGGPPMAVTDLGDYGPIGPANGAKCVWFDDKKKRCEDLFDVAVLRQHIPPSTSAKITRA